MSEQAEPIITEITQPKRYQCRHIHADGRRCGSPSLKREHFCYYHHTTRKPIPPADLNARYAAQDRRAAFDLPLPEDRAAIQLAIGQILIRIAANQLDPKRAGLLLYGLQIASLNLPPHPRPQPEEPAKPQQIVEEITPDATYGTLAPEAELTAPQGPKNLEQILMEQWAKDKEEWLAEKDDNTPKYIWDEEQEKWVLPKLQATPDQPSTSVADPETTPQTAILPEIQATTADRPTPNPAPTIKAIACSYPALIPRILVTPRFTAFPQPSPEVPSLTAQSHPTRILRDNTPYVCAETSPALSHARRVGTARSHMACMAAQP